MSDSGSISGAQPPPGADDEFDYGMGANNEALAAMRHGLPTAISGSSASQFTAPNRAVGRKGQKQNFICRVCNIDDLNSLETKMKHENGKEHVYNVFKAWQRRQQSPEDRAENNWLQVFEEVAPTRQVQKKTCIRLAEKLQNTSELVVGLEYVIEIIACSSEEEPYYECDLCPSKGQANMMYNHLLGKDHKRNVLKQKKPHIIDDNPRTIAKELAEFRQTDWSTIQRTYSDELYPWEAGKAPWSVERGGTGEIPTGAKDKIKFRGAVGTGAGPARGGADSKAGILPANIEACASAMDKISLNDTPDVRKAMDLSLNLVDKAKKAVASEDKFQIEILAASIEMNLAALKAMGHKNDQREILDQATLWEIEQNRQRIKKEKDRGYSDNSLSHNGGSRGKSSHRDERDRESRDRLSHRDERDQGSRDRPFYRDERDQVSRGHSSYRDEHGHESRDRPSYRDERDHESRDQLSYRDERDQESQDRLSYRDERDQESRDRSSYTNERDQESRGHSSYRDERYQERRSNDDYRASYDHRSYETRMRDDRSSSSSSGSGVKRRYDECDDRSRRY